jgi:hypothetical protein
MWQSDVTGKRTVHGRLGLGRGRGMSQYAVTTLVSWFKRRVLSWRSLRFAFVSASRAATAAGEWQRGMAILVVARLGSAALKEEPPVEGGWSALSPRGNSCFKKLAKQSANGSFFYKRSHALVVIAVMHSILLSQIRFFVITTSD